MIALTRTARNAVEDLVHGRRFGFGDPTPEWSHRLFGEFYVDWRQIAASVRWDVDGAGHTAIVKLGPVLLHVTLGRRWLVPDPDRPGTSWLRSRQLADGRELYVWVNWRHIGVCFDRDSPGRMARLEIGPFGAAVADPA